MEFYHISLHNMHPVYHIGLFYCNFIFILYSMFSCVKLTMCQILFRSFFGFFVSGIVFMLYITVLFPEFARLYMKIMLQILYRVFIFNFQQLVQCTASLSCQNAYCVGLCAVLSITLAEWNHDDYDDDGLTLYWVEFPTCF